MNSPSSPKSPSWPPLIEFARASWFVRLRDVVVTILAWVFLLYLVRNGVSLFVDYFFVHPIFALSKPNPLVDVETWRHLGNFGLVALVIMLWLFIWSIINGRRLRAVKRMTPPSRLPVEDQAERFQLAPETVERWREMKVSIVQFEAGNKIVAVIPLGGTDSTLPTV